MTLSPLTIKEACAFVERVHRHHKAPQGGLFAVGALSIENLRTLCTPCHRDETRKLAARRAAARREAKSRPTLFGAET